MTKRHAGTMPRDYFESLFASSADPWRLDSSDYESAKRAATIAALGGRIYDRAWEAGCARGALTAELAPHYRCLIATDISAAALDAARERLRGCEHVRFSNAAFPQAEMAGDFDLILLSEIVYYLDDMDLCRAGERIASALRPGGDVLLVHWTGETDYPQSGDDAVTKLRAALGDRVRVLEARRTDAYRLDLWRAA